MTSVPGTPDEGANPLTPRDDLVAHPSAGLDPAATVMGSQVPSDNDPVVAQAATPIGGPLGRYARIEGRTADGLTRLTRLPWQLVAAWLTLASCVSVLIGLAQKSHCYLNGWGVPDVYWRACYSDLPYFFTTGLLGSKSFPYSAADPDGSLEQPLGTGSVLWLVAKLVPGTESLEAQQWFMGVWVVLTVILVIATSVLTVMTLRRTPWSASHVALSPVVMTAALVAPEFIGITLVAAGLLLWRRQWLIPAGVVLGLAIVTRTYPLLILVVLGVLALRAGVIRQWLITAGTALLTFGGLITLVGVFTDFSVMKPYQTWQAGDPSYGSLWYVLSLWQIQINSTVLTTLVTISWSAAILAGAALALMPKRRPRVGEVALVVVGIVIIFSKSLPVQTSLWLLPLIALAGLKWRDHLIWASTEVAYFGAMWVYLGGTTDANRAMPLEWYMVFAVARLAGVAWLVVQAWRQAWARPAVPEDATDEELFVLEHDDVAGPMAARPDALVVATSST